MEASRLLRVVALAGVLVLTMAACGDGAQPTDPEGQQGATIIHGTTDP